MPGLLVNELAAHRNTKVIDNSHVGRKLSAIQYS
jgi:hypothetical protein